jgi:hypothetical protein
LSRKSGIRLSVKSKDNDLKPASLGILDEFRRKSTVTGNEAYGGY